METGILSLLSCREASRRVAEGDLDGAWWTARLFARLHLLICRRCRRYLRELELLAKAARLHAQVLLEPSRREAFERRLIERLGGPA